MMMQREAQNIENHAVHQKMLPVLSSEIRIKARHFCKAFLQQPRCDVSQH